MADQGYIISPAEQAPLEDPWGPPSPQQMTLMGMVSHYLETEFPGHPWMIGRFGDRIIVRNAFAWGMRGHSFNIRFDSLVHEEDRKRALRDLGELLERAGLPRGKVTSWAEERLVQSQKRMDDA